MAYSGYWLARWLRSPTNVVIDIRAVVVPERSGTPFRQIVLSRSGAPVNVVGHRRNANTSVPANQLRLRPRILLHFLTITKFQLHHYTCQKNSADCVEQAPTFRNDRGARFHHLAPLQNPRRQLLPSPPFLPIPFLLPLRVPPPLPLFSSLPSPLEVGSLKSG